ncbi:MAG: hypothetical protein ACT4O1_06175 [Gemmatimonadota bacterium]
MRCPIDLMSDEAARSKIEGLDGQEHELRETWAEQPAVLAFVRHFA